MSTEMLHRLDELYEAWMNAELAEKAALLMLNFRQDVEVRAAYEIAVERVEATQAEYQAACDSVLAAAA